MKNFELPLPMYPYLSSLFETFQDNLSATNDQVIVQVFQYCLPVNQSLLVQFQIAPGSVTKCRVKCHIILSSNVIIPAPLQFLYT